MNKNINKIATLFFLIIPSLFFAQNAERKVTKEIKLPIEGGKYKTKIEQLPNCTSRRLLGHDDGIWDAAFSPNSKSLATCSFDKTIKIWDIENGTVSHSLSFNNDTIMTLVWSAGSEYLITGSRNGIIVLWDIDNEKPIRTFYGHTERIYSLDVTHDFKYIVSGSADKTIKLWDIQSGELIRSFEGHSDIVYSVSISPKGTFFASGSADQTVKIWQLNNNAPISSKTMSGEVIKIGYSPDGNFLSYGLQIKKQHTSEGEYGLLDATNTKTLKSYKTSSKITSIAFANDNSFLLVPNISNSSLALQDVTNWNTKYVVDFDLNLPTSAISPNGKYIVNCGFGYSVIELIETSSLSFISPVDLSSSTPDPEITSEANLVFNFTPSNQNHNIKKPKIWAVMVGVDDYSDDLNANGAKDLDFCQSDATKIHNHFVSYKGGAVPKNQLRLLLDPTKQAILSACSNIYSQSTSEDLIVFYFSGHGGYNYFVAQDDIIMHSELREIIYSCSGNKKLILADACHSGSWDKTSKEIKRRSNPENEATNLFYQTLGNSEEGLALIMACQAIETSLESKELRQGLFTYYLIEALIGNADNNYDSIISISELFDYVERKVISWAASEGESQHPQIRGNCDPNMPIGVVIK
jgi:WD40 repeat protein